MGQLPTLARCTTPLSHPTHPVVPTGVAPSQVPISSIGPVPPVPGCLLWLVLEPPQLIAGVSPMAPKRRCFSGSSRERLAMPPIRAKTAPSEHGTRWHNRPGGMLPSR